MDGCDRFQGEKWGTTYAVVRSWETHWDDLATMCAYPADIRRLIDTTNSVEGYNRQLRKVRRTKGAFPSVEAARKLLFLVTRDSTWTWAAPVHNWTRIFESIRDPRAVALRELGRIERTLLAPKTVADVVDERWAQITAWAADFARGNRQAESDASEDEPNGPDQRVQPPARMSRSNH